jgi:hypothetical protein
MKEGGQDHWQFSAANFLASADWCIFCDKIFAQRCPTGVAKLETIIESATKL